jgi:hypothetical protein
MSCDKKNTSTMNPVVRGAIALWLALAALCASPAAFAVDSGDIVVVSLKGEVHFTMNGAARTVRAGGVLEPPATLRTGRDGSVELRQGATTLSVGPETLLEFPALEKRGAPIDRIQQPSGNVFYDIGKREGRRLRIETPYLVGVVKGTQFNVAAQDESTTISLFEGLLEVRATDDSDVVDLKAGEIASRKRGDKTISVIKMDAGKAPPSGPRQPAGSGSNDGTPSPPPRTTPPGQGGEPVVVDHSPGSNLRVPSVVVTLEIPGAAEGGSTSIGTGASVNLGNGELAVDAAANIANAADVQANAALTVGGGVDVAADARIDVGPIAVDAAANVSVGSGSIDASTVTNVDAGLIAVDVGSSVVADVAAGTVLTDTSAGVDAGSLTTDLGAATDLDLGTGTVGATVDAGAGTPLAAVDAGASVAADVGAGTVDLDLTVAGADLDLGIDLGLGNDDPSTPSTDTTTTTGTDTTDTGTVVDVGGLLDSLLRRPGRR